MGLFNNLFGKKETQKKIKMPPCPNCGVELDTIPQRKTKCPHCKKDIYVRTNPYAKSKVLVNLEDAVCLDTLKRLDVQENQFNETESNLRIKFNKKPSTSDVIWVIFDDLQLKAKRKGDWNELSQLYFMQADFLFSLGKPYRNILLQSQICTLQDMKNSGIINTEITADLCDKCANINKLEIKVEDALKSPLIPPGNCDRIGCIHYLPLSNNS